MSRTVPLTVAVACLAVLGSVAPVAVLAGSGQSVAPASVAGGAGSEGSVADGAGSEGSVVADEPRPGMECDYPLTVEDATGTNVTVDADPERIVSLAPAAAQTLRALNASDQVVGVSDLADYLPGADEKTVVSADGGAEYHRDAIRDLDPDVVLAPHDVTPQTVRALRSDGLTVYYFGDATDFAAVADRTERVGLLAGECAAASATAADVRRRVAAVREAVSDADRPGALYVFDGFTFGSETLIGAILRTAGTENLAADRGDGHFREVTDAFVANRRDDVEWLVTENLPAHQPSGAPYNRTAAVRTNRTVVLNTYRVRHPVPQVVRALENLTRAVHPAAYEESREILASTPSATATADPTTTSTAPAAVDSTPATTSAVATERTPDGGTTAATERSPDGGTTAAADAEADGDAATAPDRTATVTGPGFTVAPSLLAVLSAALLVRRRRR